MTAFNLSKALLPRQAEVLNFVCIISPGWARVSKGDAIERVTGNHRTCPLENKLLTGLSAALMLSRYSSSQEKYTTYVVARKPGLPDGYRMQDMADDYAVMIREDRRSSKNRFGKSEHEHLGRIVTHLAAIDARPPFGSRPNLAESTWRPSPSSD